MRWIMLPLLMLAAGCAAHPVQPEPPMTAPPPRPVAMTTPASTGSLWQPRGSDLFTDVKGRRTGDIVTVAIYEKASASREATTETDRATSISADITKLLGLERDIAHLANGTDPSNLLSASHTNSFSGSGITSRKEDLIATVTTQIVEVLPNGNMRIEGDKAVTVNNETQFIHLSGLVRPSDITAGNIVDSKYILDARIAYTGKGVISDKQQPGWMVRLIDDVWPF